MIKGILSLFSFRFPANIVYMLQSTEYEVRPYLKWFWRTANFSTVAKRRTLHRTRSAKLLLLALCLGIMLQLAAGILLIYLGALKGFTGGVEFGTATILSYPIVWAHLITLPLIAGRIFVVKPRQKKLIARSKTIFAHHPAVKIAVAGSYGKTSMKELLNTVLSEGKIVASTPGNKNVAISHAAFAARLDGKEEVLVIEYGEGRPGDVRQFAATTQPSIGVITGIAPAHLDEYETLDSAAKDIFSLADYLNNALVYVNQESPDAQAYIKASHTAYSQQGCDGWAVSKVKVDFSGTTFMLSKDKRKINVRSKLLGRHQIGPLSAVAAIAAKIGLSAEQIEAGLAKTEAYEHRMQPRFMHGAWIIDDTYNGNLEGIKAGISLLSELHGSRKTYVTPGLVNQGEDNEKIHQEIGRLIAEAHPHKVVLMKNSVTKYIRYGLENSGYSGEVVIEENPLGFYTNIDQYVAAGDIILMQNDWTDNYA